MSLREHGFRFIKRGAEFKWVHPAEVQPGDTDCTAMDDEEFTEAVAAA